MGGTVGCWCVLAAGHMAVYQLRAAGANNGEANQGDS